MLAVMHRALAWGLILLSCLALGAVTPPDDPLVPEQWHLPHIGTFESWDLNRGAGIVVAVVDTGVNPHHPDLLGRVSGGIDLVDVGSTPDDPNGHGTLVAGIIAATTGNGEGGAGIAPQTTILPVRVLDGSGTGSSREVAEGIRWAARNGADVINLSLAEAPGLVRGTGGIIGTDVEAAIREAHAVGVMVVAASGNEGRATTPYDPDVPIIVVGASDRQDRVWPHSNRDERTLFAPGVEIISTYIGDGYARADGTSFATPVVSAAAAILRSAGLTPQQVTDRLYATATPVTGGAGRIDLAAAATAVMATEAGPPSPSPQPPQPPPAPTTTVVPAPVPAPTPVRPPAPPSRAPAAEPAPEPEARPVVEETPPAEPSRVPVDADVTLGVPSEGRSDHRQAPSPLIPGIAVALLVANVTAHATWARYQAEGRPLFVWRLPGS